MSAKIRAKNASPTPANSSFTNAAPVEVAAATKTPVEWAEKDCRPLCRHPLGTKGATAHSDSVAPVSPFSARVAAEDGMVAGHLETARPTVAAAVAVATQVPTLALSVAVLWAATLEMDLL